MFLHLFVSHSVHRGGHACWVCMTGECGWEGKGYDGGTCMMGDVLGGGHAWWGTCRGMCGQRDVHGQRDSHCSRQYASHLNAFFFAWVLQIEIQ